MEIEHVRARVAKRSSAQWRRWVPGAGCKPEDQPMRLGLPHVPRQALWIADEVRPMRLLARFIRRSALSEGFLGKTRWLIPRASNRGGIIGSRTLSDALGVGGSGLAGRQRPAASRSGRFQRERVEVIAIGIAAADRQHAGSQHISDRVRNVQKDHASQQCDQQVYRRLSRGDRPARAASHRYQRTAGFRRTPLWLSCVKQMAG